MAEIINAYKQSVPALRFIGKKYGDGDRVGGSFGSKWSGWFSNGWFELLEKNTACELSEIYEDGDAYIGLMRWKENEPFEYWIGIFLPESTIVPEGFGSLDLPAANLGVCWVYGKDGEVYGIEHKCAERLQKDGYTVISDESGAYWFFERYCCPRFTTPDKEGNIVLDICHYIK